MGWGRDVGQAPRGLEDLGDVALPVWGGGEAEDVWGAEDVADGKTGAVVEDEAGLRGEGGEGEGPEVGGYEAGEGGVYE